MKAAQPGDNTPRYTLEKNHKGCGQKRIPSNIPLLLPNSGWLYLRASIRTDTSGLQAVQRNNVEDPRAGAADHAGRVKNPRD
jgi:hypothetical protein